MAPGHPLGAHVHNGATVTLVSAHNLGRHVNCRLQPVARLHTVCCSACCSVCVAKTCRPRDGQIDKKDSSELDEYFGTENLNTFFRWLSTRKCERKLLKEIDWSLQFIINLLNLDDELYWQLHGSASARKNKHGVCRVPSTTGRDLCDSNDW